MCCCLHSIKAGVPNCLLKNFYCSSCCQGWFAILWGITSTLAVGCQFRGLVDINGPSRINGFHVKAFSENPDFPPGVPIWWNYNFVSIDHVVSEGVSFQ